MNEPIGITPKVADPGLTVVPYREELRAAFEQLNREWIETYFVLEDADREVFSDPYAKILAPGGQIFFVVEGSLVQGTCAVLRRGAEECEIAKMAVAPAARGRGFGDSGPTAVGRRYRRANIRLERELRPTAPAWCPATAG